MTAHVTSREATADALVGLFPGKGQWSTPAPGIFAADRAIADPDTTSRAAWRGAVREPFETHPGEQQLAAVGPYHPHRHEVAAEDIRVERFGPSG